jgi:hypothetical protein
MQICEIKKITFTPSVAKGVMLFMCCGYVNIQMAFSPFSASFLELSLCVTKLNQNCILHLSCVK